MAKRVDIRLAGDDDLDRVQAVHAAHNHSMRGTGPATALEQTTWRRMRETPGLSIYVAENDGEPVATASSMLRPNVTYGCAPTAFIEAVVVVPTHRRRGIATALLEQVLVDIAEAGGHMVQLLSHKRHAMDGAHELYRKAEFESEAEGFRLYLRPQHVP